MRSFGVSYGQGRYLLHLDEVPPFWRAASWLVDKVCMLTRHHFCYQLAGPVDTREHRATERLLAIELTEEQARVLSPDLVSLFEDGDDDDE